MNIYLIYYPLRSVTENSLKWLCEMRRLTQCLVFIFRCLNILFKNIPGCISWYYYFYHHLFKLLTTFATSCCFVYSYSNNFYFFIFFFISNDFILTQIKIIYIILCHTYNSLFFCKLPFPLIEYFPSCIHTTKVVYTHVSLYLFVLQVRFIAHLLKGLY